MEIVQKFITTNYTKGRQGQKPIQITFHTAVAKTDSLFSWFNNPKTKSSTHYYVNQHGVVEQYVREEDTAWSNSNWNANIRSITIETWDNANPNDSVRTPEMYESCSQLLAKFYRQYKQPLIILSKEQSLAWQSGLTLHKYFVAKSCPAGLDVQRIINRTKEILNITPTTTMVNLNPVQKYKTLNTAEANLRSTPYIKSDNIVGKMPPLSDVIANKIDQGDLISQNGRSTNNWIFDSQRNGWFNLCWADLAQGNADCSVQDAKIVEQQAQISTLTTQNNELTAKNEQLINEVNSFIPNTIYTKK